MRNILVSSQFCTVFYQFWCRGDCIDEILITYLAVILPKCKEVVAVWYPVGAHCSKSPFHLTLVFTVESIVLCSIEGELHFCGILSFLAIAHHVEVVLLGIEEVKTVWRVFHPVRIYLLIVFLLIRRCQLFGEYVIEKFIRTYTQFYCLIVF